MSETRKTGLAAAFNLLGGISGLTCLIGGIWYGGALSERIETHDRLLLDFKARIITMEANGSAGLHKHVAQDDERQMASDARLKNLEEAVKVFMTFITQDFATMKADVREIKTEVRMLSSAKSNP